MLLVERFKDQFGPLMQTALKEVISDIEVVDFNEELSAAMISKNTVIVGDAVKTRDILLLMRRLGVEHFVQLDRKDHVRDIITSCMLLKKPGSFLENPIPFFVGNFEGKKNYDATARKTQLQMLSTLQKQNVIDMISHFIEEDARTKYFSNSILTILDELISNAFFNAPVDLNGIQIYKNKNRSEEIRIKRPVRIFIAHDDYRFVVGVVDPWGSVERNALLDTLLSAFLTEQADVSQKTSGAGLGCKMIIDNSVAFYTVVNRNIKTGMFCVLQIDQGLRRMTTLPKNLHFSFY